MTLRTNVLRRVLGVALVVLATFVWAAIAGHLASGSEAGGSSQLARQTSATSTTASAELSFVAFRAYEPAGEWSVLAAVAEPSSVATEDGGGVLSSLWARVRSVDWRDETGSIGGDGLSPNQMNRAIQRGQAPSGISRVDVGRVPGEQLHVHFDDGSALNVDGTWKHGGGSLTSAQAGWLAQNGWSVP